MRPRAARGVVARLFATLMATALVAGCAPGPRGDPTADSSGSGAPPTSPVEGVIVRVESQGLDQVTSFRLRTSDGDLLDFSIGSLENGDEFPPGHLTEHQATSDPIRVFFRMDGGSLVAIRLEDAAG